MLSGVPGISVLRVLRVFRILRVIKRFDSLLRITNAIFQVKQSNCICGS